MTSRNRFLWFAAVVAALGLGASVAAAAASVEDQLRAEYLHKYFVIRCLCAEDDLVFGAGGQVIKGGGQREAWTVSDVYIDGLSLHGDKLVIEGKRVGLLYDSTTNDFQRIYRVKFKERHRTEVEVLRIRIEGGRRSSGDQWTKALGAVFTPDDQVGDIVPDYWRSFLGKRKAQNAPDKTAARDESSPPAAPPGAAASDRLESKAVLRLGAGVSPPRQIFDPQPEYSEAARRNRIQGRLTLSLMLDRTGIPTQVGLDTPLGFGLDEKAIDAVKQWRFKPAERDGQPVAVLIRVEINFRLY